MEFGEGWLKGYRQLLGILQKREGNVNRLKSKAELRLTSPNILAHNSILVLLDNVADRTAERGTCRSRMSRHYATELLQQIFGCGNTSLILNWKNQGKYRLIRKYRSALNLQYISWS